MIIGILGAGQLGRMLALAGYPFGWRFRFLDPAPDSPASHLAEQRVGSYLDEEVLFRFVEGVDRITYEFENVPVETARFLETFAPVFPPPLALEVAQDRLTEKTLCQSLGIPPPPFTPVATRTELEAALATQGLPAVLKTRRLGYDGKGQWLLRTPADVVGVSENAFASPSGLLLEGFVPFEREVSLLSVRAQDGQIAFYPLVENHHREGILRLSLAPAPDLSPALQAQAEEYATRLLNHLQYVGVLALEFFVHQGQLLFNEMAPRVHNSGHWSIEGAETSQFENHLRAVAGLPLGSTSLRGYAAMHNLIGETPSPESVLPIPGAHLHLYGKSPRPGRKLGHITILAENPEVRQARLEALGVRR